MFVRTVILMSLSLALAVVADDSPRSTSGDSTSDNLTGIRSNGIRSNSETVEATRGWQYVVVHHSATTQGSVESIDRNHKARRDSNGNPWLGIGYHFVIGNGEGMPDGEVAATFRWLEQLPGAHAGSKLYNDFGIGVCLIGNFENAPPSEKQTAALKTLIKQLTQRCEIRPTDVIAHGDIRQTACPGKLFPRNQFVTAELHTTRRIDFAADPIGEPSCDDVVRTAETSSNWKESR